jgi:hypothetical protein
MNVRIRPIRRRATGWLAAGALAMLAAVLAFLLAHDVRSWRDTLRGDGVRFAVSPTAPVSSTAPTLLPSSVSARVLDVGRDRRWLSVLRLFALAEAVDTSGGITPPDEALLRRAETALSAATQDPNPALASQAYELLSVILFKDAKAGFVQDVATYSSSIAAMQNAVLSDPTNKQAEADLELLLRQFAADQRVSQQRQSNNQGPRHKKGQVGRGKGVPPLNSPSGDY